MEMDSAQQKRRCGQDQEACETDRAQHYHTYGAICTEHLPPAISLSGCDSEASRFKHHLPNLLLFLDKKN